MRRESTYRFGEYEIDVENLMLRRGSHPLPIQALPFRALVLLIAREGELVRREDLIRELWDDAYVDAERGLNTAIKKARLALGAPGAGWIQTVRGLGYRFVEPPATGFWLQPLRLWANLRPGARVGAALAVLAVALVGGTVVEKLRSRPRDVPQEAPETVLAAAAVTETCDDETTLRIAVEPLLSDLESGVSPLLGRALADDIAGALWSVDERRLAAIRTWEADADLTGIDYVLNGRIRPGSPEIELELVLRPTRLGGPEWRGTIRLPENEPFLPIDRVTELVEHLTSAEA